MKVAEVENMGEGRSSDTRRKYVMPIVSRYGTLADLTKANGTKNLNDSSGGQGGGCGSNNFQTSCMNPS